MSRWQTLASFCIVVVAVSQAAAPVVPPKTKDIKVTDTPAVTALCLAGQGDATAYATAATRLYSFFLSKGVPQTSIFTSQWHPSAIPAESHWDVCAETTLQAADATAPFEVRQIAPEPAVYARCDMGSSNFDGALSACTAEMTRYAVELHRPPTVPARHGAVNQTAFDVWLPIIPPPPPPTAPGQTPPTPVPPQPTPPPAATMRESHFSLRIGK